MNTTVGTSGSLGAALDIPDRHLLEFGRLSRHQKSDNQTEQAKDGTEDLDNQNPDEPIVPMSARRLEKGIVWGNIQARVCSVSQRSTASVNAD